MLILYCCKVDKHLSFQLRLSLLTEQSICQLEVHTGSHLTLMHRLSTQGSKVDTYISPHHDRWNIFAILDNSHNIVSYYVGKFVYTEPHMDINTCTTRLKETA